MFRFAAALALCAAPATAQTASDKLPPANPLPYEDADANAVMAPINALFAAMRAGDATALLAQLRPGGQATAAGVNNGQRVVKTMTWAEFAVGIKPGGDRMEEVLTDAAIDVDGDIAMVWGPYVFKLNGKVAQCGVDHFSLVRENGRWLIQSVTWSTRQTSCPA